MKKLIIFVIVMQFFSIIKGQIIADHSVVDKFLDIPQQYIETVKKMWLVVPGESHSQAYRVGLTLLADLYPEFATSSIESGEPEPNTAVNLRVSRATWGDINNSSGWIYSYGEEDWCCFVDYPSYTYNPAAVARTKASITYCNENGLAIGAFGLAHCYDDGENLFNSYLKATEEYMQYCEDMNYPTKVFFTTGPVDGYMASGASGYQQYLKWQHIRDSVAIHPDWILFDYADILSYDNDGSLTSVTWDGHTFPVITPTNQGSTGIGHIDAVGAIRLAKAMWWMLARMAGWDGTVDGEDNVAPSAPSSLSLSSVSQGSVSIAWAASSDNVGVTEYLVYRDGIYLGSSTELSFNDNSLTVCDTYIYTVKAVDAAGNESAASSGLSVANCAPDVTPTLIVTPNISHGLTSFEVIVRITELNMVNTNGSIIVNMPADSRWSLEGAFDPSLTSLDGIDLNNADWNYSSDAVNHTFTSSVSIPAGGFSTFGFRITFNPDTSRGLYTITSQIVSGAGGELRESNNADSERLDYFQ